MNVIHHETPKARKPHRCAECGHDIAAGTVYTRQRNTCGGDIWTYKAHEDCHDFALQVLDEEGGFVLMDNASWALGQDPPPEVRARLEAL